jgi:phosphoglycolate phosphatase
VVGAAAVEGNVLERAFIEAIATQGVVTGTAAYVKAMVQFDRTRGWSPADVIHSLFPEDEIRAWPRPPTSRSSGRSRPLSTGSVPSRCPARTTRWPSWPRPAPKRA